MRNLFPAHDTRKAVLLPTLCAGAMTALLAAAPLSGAHAQTAGQTTAHGASAMAEHESRADAVEDTIDQRITTLHAELKITTAEEPDWKAVAQTMRDNAGAMEKLASEKQSQSSAGMTAVQDLQTYGTFAQAHVDNLKKLTGVFETLYNTMPAAQKKLADQVFARSHHDEQEAAHKPG